MANYNIIKTLINQDIRVNGEQAITGAILNNVLQQVVNTLGTGYRFGGFVLPDSPAQTSDNRVFYLGVVPGTYANFGGTVVTAGKFGYFSFDLSWAYRVVDLGAYVKPDSGIPAADLAQAVQTSLGKADVAACVTRRGLEETGVAFDPSGESFIVYASNYTYTEVYFIECGDDYTNVHVTMLSEPDTELGPLVDFHPYDGELLVWPNEAINFSVIRLGEPGQVVFTNVADKSGADPKIEPELFVRKSLLDALLAEKANVDGYYERLTAGGAEKLIAPSDVVDDSLEQTTGGNAEVANGLARINEVKGKSQVWNQLVQNGNFADTSIWTTYYSAALTVNSNVGTLTLNARYGVMQQAAPLVAKHAYFFAATYKTSTSNFVLGIGQYNSLRKILTATADGAWHTESIVWSGTDTAILTADKYIFVGNREQNSGSIDLKNVIVIDLTLLGIDNLTTPEQVEAWLAKNKGLKPYYPYDAGSILNAKLIGLESYGRNLLNPSTNKARIIGRYSDTYGNYYGITGTYDSISFTSDLGETTAITPDSDGKFVLTDPGELSVANPGADCAVFIWWDGKKTDFTPYKTDKAYIDLTHIYGKLNGEGELVQVFPDGARGVNSVKDRLYVEDGEVKAKVACGKVDLGTPNYYYSSNVGAFYQSISAKSNGGSILSPIYVNGGVKSSQSDILSSPDKSIYTQPSNNNFFIKDSAYSGDAQGIANLKAALNGVFAYFPLATPLIYTDLVYRFSEHFENGTPVELPVDYDVDNYGMEVQILGSDSVPAELSVRYQMDAAEAIDTLQTEMAEVQEVTEPTNLISAASMDNFLSALGTAMEGTWTKTWNSSTGKYDFTFTPNS